MKKKNDKFPKYSVLMSVYKNENANVLEQSLESVFNQTILCNEFVLVEDGPITSESATVIDRYCKKYPNIIKTVTLPNNVGLGIALQLGVNKCRNELIARFDSDDISVPERCEKQLTEFINDPKLDIVGSNHIEFVDSIENKSSYLLKRLPISDSEIKKYAKKRNPFSHSAVMYKKSKVLAAGNYRSYYYVEDYDLWVRMIQCGCKCKNIDEYLSYVRISEDLYKRRGGLKYLKSLLKFKKELLDNGFYSIFDFIKSAGSHCIVCLLPGTARKYIYKKFLRK